MGRVIKDPDAPLYRVAVIHEWDADPSDHNSLYHKPGSSRDYYGTYRLPGTAAWVGSYYSNRSGEVYHSSAHRFSYEVQKQNPSWDVKVPATWVPVHSV